MVVGWYIDSSGDEDGLADVEADGVWSTSELLGPPGSFFDLLFGVGCDAVGSCVAVGNYDDTAYGDGPDDTYDALIDTLSDGTWTPTEGPALAVNQDNGLAQVTCLAAGSCVAIGSNGAPAGQGGELLGLIATESDGTWGGQQTPLPDNAFSDPQITDLSDLTCLGQGACVVVGSYSTAALPDEDAAGVVEMLSDGNPVATESELPSNATTSATEGFSGLTAVSCSPDGSCAAVGDYVDTSGHEDGVIDTFSFAAATLSPINVTSTLPNAVIGLPYSLPLSVYGGIFPYTWSTPSGTLPPGLSLDPAGVVSGIPTAVGTSSFTLEVTDSTPGTPQTTQTTVSLDVTLPFSVQTVATQSGGPTVAVDVNGCPFSPSLGSSAYTWTLNGADIDETSCSFYLDLSVGPQILDLSVTDSSGTFTTIDSLTVSPFAGFTYNVEPVPYGGSTSSAWVDFDACAQSAGISNYSWNGQSTGTSCDERVQLPSGNNDITLTTTGTDGSTLTVSQSIYVDPILEQPTTCVTWSLGSDACWRQDLDFVGDVFGANNDRPPDYAVISVGASAGVGTASVSEIVTCDGSIYADVSFGVAAATPDPTGVLAFGYVGDPSTVAPTNAQIDAYVAGEDASRKRLALYLRDQFDVEPDPAGSAFELATDGGGRVRHGRYRGGHFRLDVVWRAGPAGRRRGHLYRWDRRDPVVAGAQ